MKLFSDHDPRFRLLAVKVALFLLVAFVGLLLIMGGLGMVRGIFTKKTPFYFVAANALDIKPGMAVMLSGFKIGSVDTLTLRDDARVKVDVKIEDRYIEWMRQDTVLEVRKQGFLGEAYINVNPGSSTQLLAHDGKGEVGYKTAKGFDEIAASIEDRVMPVVEDVHTVVKDMHTLMAYANDDKGDIRRTLANLQLTTQRATNAVQTLDQTMADVHRTINSDVRPLIASTQQTVDLANQKISAVDVQAIQGQTNSALLKVNRSLDDINTMTRDLKTPVAQTAPKIPAFVDDTQTLVRQAQISLRSGDVVMQDVQIILDRARQNWPLNTWAPSSSVVLIPQDSHD